MLKDYQLLFAAVTVSVGIVSWLFTMSEHTQPLAEAGSIIALVCLIIGTVLGIVRRRKEQNDEK